jgi:8-oxo-dGTP pyrophosphatase MutT (NUDIX family)
VRDTGRVVSIRRALASFQPNDRGQDGALTQMERLLAEEQGDPFSRAQLQPGHFTASGLVLSEDEQSLLLIFHPKLERWLQPGGHFEAEDADHVAAARREVSEEVGIDELELVSPLYDLDVHSIPATAREGEHLHFDIRALFRCRASAIRPSNEVIDARYFRLLDLAAAGDSTDDSVARVARRLLKS